MKYGKKNISTAKEVEEAQHMAIEALRQTEWIPVKWHEIMDEEREIEGYPKDWEVFMDCEMPCDEQEILVQTKNGYIRWDVCYEDGEFSLDSVQAPPEANEYKAEVYKIIQSMGTEEDDDK